MVDAPGPDSAARRDGRRCSPWSSGSSPCNCVDAHLRDPAPWPMPSTPTSPSLAGYPAPTYDPHRLLLVAGRLQRPLRPSPRLHGGHRHLGVAGGTRRPGPRRAMLIVLRGLQGRGRALMTGTGWRSSPTLSPAASAGGPSVSSRSRRRSAAWRGCITALCPRQLSWQWLFWVLWPIGCSGCGARAGSTRAARDAAHGTARRARRRLLFLALAVGTLSLNHLHGGETQFPGGRAYHTAMQVLALLLLGAFIFVERRRTSP